MDGAAPGALGWAIASPEPSSVAVVNTAKSGESLDFLMDAFIVILISLGQPDGVFARRRPPGIFPGKIILGMGIGAIIDLV
jgi:hypothetical protein